MRFRGRIFGTLAGARTARTSAGFTADDLWRAIHREGTHPRGWRFVGSEGRAASRIRARGVSTLYRLVILRNAALTAFALPEPDGRTLTGAAEITSGFDDAGEDSA